MKPELYSPVVNVPESIPPVSDTVSTAVAEALNVTPAAAEPALVKMDASDIPLESASSSKLPNQT